MEMITCPVCKGSGKYKELLFNDTLTTTHNPYIEKICHGCNGKGWVVYPKPKEAKYE